MDICFPPGKPPIPREKEGDAHGKIKFLKHKVDRSGRDSEFVCLKGDDFRPFALFVSVSLTL